MPSTGKARNFAGTVVGYVIVAIVLWYFFRWIFSAVLWIFRTLFIIIVLIALLWLYFKLKSPGKKKDDDEDK